MGGDEEGYRKLFRQVEQSVVVKCEYCMPYENNLPVYMCRAKKININEIWESMKHFE